MKHYDNTHRALGIICTLVGFLLLGLAISAVPEMKSEHVHGGLWITLPTLIVLGAAAISKGLKKVSQSVQHREVFHYTDPRINKIIYPKST